MDNLEVDEFGSRRSTVYGSNGIVASSQSLASQAGLQMLQAGGNAFDAAVATAATLNVVEPTSTGLGGDVFMLYRTADGTVGAMRACGGAPSGATRRAVRTAISNDETDVRMPETGPHTVTVPGTARGWEATIVEYGKLTLSDVLDPAIRYAIDGYPVSPVIADAWIHGETLFETPHARSAYLVDGTRAPHPGEWMTLPELGASMEAIAESGADVVYEGHIGEAIVDEVQRHGGFLDLTDLADFSVEWVDPVSTTYDGNTVYELPPNNQGLIALEALNIAEFIGVGEYSPHTADRTHYLIESMKRAFVDGHYYITDPSFESIPPLGSKEWAAERADTIDETAREPAVGPISSPAENADTVLLCVADAAGNVVSYINSRFEGFGSGLVAGNTGIALQNRGASFSLNPDHPNRLEPNKKPFHTLIPALLERDEDDWTAFGVMGGYMQPQGHLQVLIELLENNAPLQQALDAPRWRYLASGRVAIEPRIASEIQHGLLRRGHELEVLPPREFGGGQLARYQNGILSGATEPRKDGTVATY